MPDFAGALGASKAASTLLVLFIPSKDRGNKPIDQRSWVKETLGFPRHRVATELATPDDQCRNGYWFARDEVRKWLNDGVF